MRAPGALSSLEWTPRGIALLGRLWNQAERWDDAHEAFDRLARVELDVSSKHIPRQDRAEIRELIDYAYLARADASYKSGNYIVGLDEYDQAAKRLVELPIVLWAEYQLGNCYLKLNRELDRKHPTAGRGRPLPSDDSDNDEDSWDRTDTNDD